MKPTKTGNRSLARVRRILTLIALPLVVIAFVGLVLDPTTYWYEWLLVGSVALNLLVGVLHERLRDWPLAVLQTVALVMVIAAVIGIVGSNQ